MDDISKNLIIGLLIPVIKEIVIEVIKRYMNENHEYISDEDLKYLRDIAETEAINRFTTAEIKVEMTNNNNVSGDMDLDGMVDYLANGVNEAMEKAAEGVHD